MVVKNLESIAHLVVRIEGILETDKTLSKEDRHDLIMLLGTAAGILNRHGQDTITAYTQEVRSS